MIRYLYLQLTIIAVLLFSVPLQANRPTLADQLHRVALEQPRPWYDDDWKPTPGAEETEEEYVKRTGLLVQALVEATVRERKNGTYAVIPPNWFWHRKVLVVAVLAHWYEESRFAYEVHAGLDHPVWDQDKGRARCLGQLHAGLVPLRDWQELAGLDLDATKRCALWTARALTRMALSCSRGKRGANTADEVLLPMFSAMGGNGCSPTSKGRAKYQRFAKMWSKL